ncbi:translational activator GCN1 [Gossypium australe]|uniref:Translational activator GCN1 n=1 Tax=Gossypium australe TaxID=47621 RepID=A0A5B6VVE8_9ROSI|nr:translational activator GCN1 [Gossypium australe]
MEATETSNHLKRSCLKFSKVYVEISGLVASFNFIVPNFVVRNRGQIDIEIRLLHSVCLKKHIGFKSFLCCDYNSQLFLHKEISLKYGIGLMQNLVSSILLLSFWFLKVLFLAHFVVLGLFLLKTNDSDIQPVIC